MQGGRPADGHAITEDLRTSLVNAALRLFSEKGYHATSLQNIIEAAGCSKGAFYHYFGSKEDLLLMFHDMFIDHLVEYAERVRQEPGDPLERLQRITHHLLESMTTFRNHMAVFSNEMRYLSKEKFARVKAKRDRYEEAVRALVAEAMAQGRLRPDLDPKIYTLAILGVFNWAFRWFKPNQPKSTLEMSAMLLDILIWGGAPRPTPPHD